MNNKLNFQKIVLVALVAALVAAALPLTGASAAASFDPTQPPAGQGLSNERLEAIWQKMVNRYDRVGKMFDNDARLAEGAEKMIERLKQEGKPTAELESALKAYEDALKKAKPVFESCKGIINSHKGFDSSGKVTDAGQAKETIRDLGRLEIIGGFEAVLRIGGIARGFVNLPDLEHVISVVTKDRGG